MLDPARTAPTSPAKERCQGSCDCTASTHVNQLVVVTGGPGAGKTAVLELVRRTLCKHVAVLPEAASIIFGGGFPRHPTDPCRRASQRAIFHVQRELEALLLEENQAAITLCDRGTLDGMAYWPDGEASWLAALGTTLEAEMARYAAVIHLRTPAAAAYNHDNPLRIEDAVQAASIDARIAEIWSRHPRVWTIDAANNFVDKATRAIALIRQLVPACCR